MASEASQAIRRLQKELQGSAQHQKEGFTYAPVNNDLFHWNATLTGPVGEKRENSAVLLSCCFSCSCSNSIFFLLFSLLGRHSLCRRSFYCKRHNPTRISLVGFLTLPLHSFSSMIDSHLCLFLQQSTYNHISNQNLSLQCISASFCSFHAHMTFSFPLFFV